jgi:hypothetical protein
MRKPLTEFYFEVIVADNGSSAALAPVVARHPGVRLVTEERPGPGLALIDVGASNLSSGGQAGTGSANIR